MYPKTFNRFFSSITGYLVWSSSVMTNSNEFSKYLSHQQVDRYTFEIEKAEILVLRER